MQKLKLLTFIILFFVFGACVPINNSPSSTQPPNVANKTPSLIYKPTSTQYVTSTFTPLPSPTLIPCEIKDTSFDHEWCPENVLVDFYISIGDGGSTVNVPPAPYLILYADGKMFIVRSEEQADSYIRKMLYKQFDKKGVCQILNTFEKVGYLNYNPLEYQFIGGDQFAYIIGAGTVQIKINAWETTIADYYGLDIFLSEREKNLPEVIATPMVERVGWPIIDTKLMNAFYFINYFPMDDFVVYQPEKLGIWVVPLDEKYLEFNILFYDLAEWDVDGVSLNEISEKPIDNNGFEDRYIILTGKQADEAFSKLNHSLNTFLFFEEDANGKKNYYFVESRPILPYETIGNRYYYEIPDPNAPKPSEPIGCNNSDGVLPIPSP